MTFEKLKELIEKYNVPYNVKLLSDSGWQFGSTAVHGVYYNEKRNHIIFTSYFNTKYENFTNWKKLK